MKIGHIIILVLVLLAVHTPVSGQRIGQTTDKILSYLVQNDTKNARALLATINTDSLVLEPDSVWAVVNQMIDSARVVTETRPEEALKLLDGAEEMLRNADTGNADPAPVYYYLYLSKFEPLARLLKMDSLKSTFRKTVPFFQQLEPQAWFTKYTDNINGMAVVLAENEHFAEAIDLFDFLKSEAARYHEQVDSMALTTEKNVRKRYQFKLDNDALVEAFKKEKDVDKWVHLGIVASNYYYRRSHPEEAVNIALQVYQRISADEKLYKYKEETLRRLIDAYALANDYTRAYPYVLECEKIVREKYGEKQEYADIRNIHAVVVMDVNLNEARECLEDAGKILSKLHGDDSEEVIPIMGNWGRWYQLQKKYEQARHFYAKARDLQMKYYGEVNPLTRKRLEEVEYALSIKL